MPVLHLIPSPIANPVALPEFVGNLRHLIVENLRETRRFLRANFPNFPIDECRFLEINLQSIDRQAIQRFLEDAFAVKADIGLLSDAGLPCVADPGSVVVEMAHRIGFSMNPLPGPSSLLMALMASGFNGQRFAFHGYLPIEEKEQVKTIRQLEDESMKRNMTQLFIETPYRNNKLLQQLLACLKNSTRVCVAVDLDSPLQEIISLSVADWKKKTVDFHKRPAVFLLYAH